MSAQSDSSGKFHPIHQNLYFDAVEALPAPPPSPTELSGKVSLEAYTSSHTPPLNTSRLAYRTSSSKLCARALWQGE